MTMAYGLKLQLLKGLLTAAIIIMADSFAFSQNTVSGSVLDGDGKPLTGATIRNISRSEGTTSDSSGQFRIKAVYGDRLLVSYVGFISVERRYNGEPHLINYLKEDVRTLEDVVAIGYGTAKRKDLTGAITSLQSKDLNSGIYTSPDLLMQGKISGLQLANNNGQPGGSALVRIRGNSALSGTGQPLFVIDGILLDGRSLQAGNNPLNFINATDIYSIDVLKDASATAIYGSRAAYGVVIINTKKGKSGPARINVGASAGFASILKKIRVLNANEFRGALAYYNVPADFDKGGNTDALDAILQNGLQQNYSVAITGGNETGKYRLSFNHTDQNGILRNTGFSKYALDVSGNFLFLDSKKLGIDVNLLSSQYIQKTPAPADGASRIMQAALQWNPTDLLKNADGSLKIRPGDPDNPLALNELTRAAFKVTTILGNIAPYYKFTDWLEYKLLFGINYNAGVSRTSENQLILQPGDQRGSASIVNTEMITQQLTQTLTFDKELAAGFRLVAVGGLEYMKFVNKGSSVSAFGVRGTGFGNFGLDYTNYIQYSSTSDRSIASYIDPKSSLTSYFARTIFNWKNKYLLTVTARADGSSKFGSNNQYAWFPSFAVGWNIDKEDFFRLSVINRLKVRAGWGKTGNQEFPAGSAQAKYSFRDNGAIIQVNSPNADLKWQSDRQYNIGIDFAMWDNRITGTIDYFDKTTTNLLYPNVPIQPAPPLSLVRWMNLDGKIINRGLEAAVNSSILRGDAFSLDIGVNATFLSNSVSAMPKTIITGALRGSGASGATVEVIGNGVPMNAFFTRKFIGIDKANGVSKYETNDATFYYVGNPNPSTLLGLSSLLRYKKFSLTTTWYGTLGQDIFFNTLMNVINVGGINFGRNISADEYKAPVKESIYNAVTPSSRFIRKGNYIKLSNVTLAAELGKPTKAFKGFIIYVTGQNLLLFTKYPGFDPESNFDGSNNGIPSLGIDFVQYPSSKLLTIGLKLSL
jgi:iron complex outermembrane receptor protein